MVLPLLATPMTCLQSPIFSRRRVARLKAGRGGTIRARGPYPGDWERACRELADAGFNMILPKHAVGRSGALSKQRVAPEPDV